MSFESFGGNELHFEDATKKLICKNSYKVKSSLSEHLTRENTMPLKRKRKEKQIEFCKKIRLTLENTKNYRRDYFI